jgi:hypothetical protein
MKSVLAAGILMVATACSDPTSPSLPSRRPDFEGLITHREDYNTAAQILIDEAPGTPPCLRGQRITAAFYSINSRTFVVRRLSDGKLRTFSPDSLLPGTRVRAWKDHLPALDSCPPILSAEALEMVS